MPDDSAGGGGLNLSNLTGLEKPATELINRVSDAVGGIAKPWQITRVAKAEAEAKKIAAIADLEITDLQQRALKRLVLEEEKNQENVEAITAKAIPHLSEQAQPGNLDEDFVRYFFDKAKLVSNEDMQEVWAKILAGEANTAGSFSRKTIDIVGQMGKQDADLFIRLCHSVWIIGDRCLMMAMDQKRVRDDDDYSMSFTDLVHIESMGLIRYDPTGGYSRNGFPRKFPVKYARCDITLEFETENDDYSTSVGPAILTAAGIELSSLVIGIESVVSFESQLRRWIDAGIRVSVAIDMKDNYPRGT
jgi:hypothetical protein